MDILIRLFLWLVDLLYPFRPKLDDGPKWTFADRWRLGRRIEHAKRAARKRPSDAKSGETVCVEGSVQPIEALVRAPFTNNEVVVWIARLETRDYKPDYESGDPRKEVWTTELRDRSDAPFWLVDDAGGRVRVELTSHAVFDCGLSNVSRNPRVNDENAELVRFLRSHGIVATAHMGIAGDTRFFETGRVAGERLAVFGRIQLLDGVPTLAGTRDETLVFVD